MATNKSVGYAVDAPPPLPALHGLLNRITLQDPDSTRWEGGIGYESITCAGIVELHPICTPPAPIEPIVDGTGKDRGVYAPSFGITAIDTCTSTFGSDFRANAEKRALALLEQATAKAVESELKNGWLASTATPPSRWLTGPGTVVVDSSGVSPKVAHALLADAWAGCTPGGAGVLHVTPGTATALRDLEDDDGVLFDIVGNMVAAGQGYAPTGSEAAPWDGTWAFITGPVAVWLDEPKVYPEDPSQAVAIATNDIRFKAERMAAVTFDGCCAFAVKVDLTKI